MNIEIIEGLNRIDFAKARKDMALGRITDMQLEKANSSQKNILHQIDLTIQSISLEDLSELEE